MDAQAFSQAMRLLREAKTAEDSGNEESEEESQERWEAFDDITDYIISPNRFATLFDSARTLQRTSYENTVYNAMQKTLKPKQLHAILHDFSDVDTKVLKKFVGDNIYDQEKVHAELAKRGSSVRQKTPSPPREISRSPPASTSVFSLSDMSGRGKGGKGLGKEPRTMSYAVNANAGGRSDAMKSAMAAIEEAADRDDEEMGSEDEDMDDDAGLRRYFSRLQDAIYDIESNSELAKVFTAARNMEHDGFGETVLAHMEDVMNSSELFAAKHDFKDVETSAVERLAGNDVYDQTKVLCELIGRGDAREFLFPYIMDARADIFPLHPDVVRCVGAARDEHLIESFDYAEETWRKEHPSQASRQGVATIRAPVTHSPVTSVYKASSPIHVRDSVSPPRDIYRTAPVAAPAAAAYAAASTPVTYTPVTYDQFMHAAGNGVFSTFTRGVQLYNKPLQLGEALVLAAENNKEFITQDLLGETLVFPDESNKDSIPHTVATYPGIPDNYLTDANHYAISHKNEQMKNQLMRYVDKNNPRLLIQFLRRSMRDGDEDRAVRIARLIKKNRTDLSREDVELQEYVNSVETEKIPSRAPRPQVSTKPPQSAVRTLATTRPSPPRQSAAASTFTAHSASTFTAHPSVESSIKALRAADKEAGTIFLAAARSGDTDTMLRFVKLEEFAHLRWMSKALVLAAQYGHAAKMHFLFE